MALTDFQLKKVENVYVNLYDSNKDGIIDLNDFSLAIEKISELHHWGKNDEQYAKAKKTLGDIWEGLRTVADKNKDGVVTLEEWINMWKGTMEDIKAGKPFPKWQQDYMEFMFYANDTSGDGFIDEEEYVTIQTIFGNSDADSKKAFGKLSQGTGGKISKEDFENLWKEYFLSTDPSHRGNYLFGMPPQ